MVLPKVLSPSFWVDKCLTLVLQLVLALLLQILYILKGEDVRVTDVKVTVRKAIPSDRKSIIQSPAKATRPARQNITVKAGPNAAPGESTREIKAPIIASKKPEEGIITGTLTELKPDKIEKIEVQAEISTSTATSIIETETVTFEVEKSEDVEVKAKELVKVQAEKIKPEVKGNEAKTSEPVEVIFDEPEVPENIFEDSQLPIEIKAGEPEVSKIISGMVKEGIVSKMAEESSKPVKVIPEPKANEVEVSETVSKMAEESSKPVKVIPEVKADEAKVSEMISETIDKDKDTAKTGITQLPPEMKTSHDITHSDSHIEIVAFQWNKHGDKVSVRGSSDDWKVDHEMQPDYTNGGFVAFIPIDRTKNYEFKFVVDDEYWEVDDDLKTEYDERGNRNNVIPAFASDQLSHEYKKFSGIPTSHQLAAAH